MSNCHHSIALTMYGRSGTSIQNLKNDRPITLWCYAWRRACEWHELASQTQAHGFTHWWGSTLVTRSSCLLLTQCTNILTYSSGLVWRIVHVSHASMVCTNLLSASVQQSLENLCVPTVVMEDLCVRLSLMGYLSIDLTIPWAAQVVATDGA